MHRLLLPLLALTGCDILDEVTSTEPGIRTEQVSVTSGANGLAAVDVDVTTGVDAFLVTGLAEDGYLLALERIEDDVGDVVLDWQDWASEPRSLTGAIYAESQDTVVNWPVREVDGLLSHGTWTVWLATVNESGNYVSNVGADVVVQRKVDEGFGSGVVKVTVAWADGVGDDAAVVDATEQAVERWAEIWGAYGLSLDVSYVDAGVDADLPYASSGGDAIETASALGNNRDVTVIIGETIEGSTDYYGVAGSIPGALVSAPRSAVVISWLANSGGDGSFSEDDIRLYGETLAHEVGHYTGLFHPVESSYDWWDALDDTPECSSASRCESELGDNLMFPYPVCGWSSCEPQDQLTPEQEGVMQRYTGTL